MQRSQGGGGVGIQERPQSTSPVANHAGETAGMQFQILAVGIWGQQG